MIYQQITSRILTPVVWSEKLITCDQGRQRK